jgi:hypothetical protein
VGLLFILAKLKQQKRQEKMLIIAGKVRQSFVKEQKHITPYSGKYSFLIKVYTQWAETICCIEYSSQNGNSYFQAQFYKNDDSGTYCQIRMLHYRKHNIAVL